MGKPERPIPSSLSRTAYHDLVVRRHPERTLWITAEPGTPHLRRPTSEPPVGDRARSALRREPPTGHDPRRGGPHDPSSALAMATLTALGVLRERPAGRGRGRPYPAHPLDGHRQMITASGGRNKEWSRRVRAEDPGLLVAPVGRPDPSLGVTEETFMAQPQVVQIRLSALAKDSDAGYGLEGAP